MGSEFFKKGGKRIPWILSRGTSFNKGEISRAYTTDTNTTSGDGQNRGETHCWVNVKTIIKEATMYARRKIHISLLCKNWSRLALNLSKL